MDNDEIAQIRTFLNKKRETKVEEIEKEERPYLKPDIERNDNIKEEPDIKCNILPQNRAYCSTCKKYYSKVNTAHHRKTQLHIKLTNIKENIFELINK